MYNLIPCRVWLRKEDIYAHVPKNYIRPKKTFLALVNNKKTEPDLVYFLPDAEERPDYPACLARYCRIIQKSYQMPDIRPNPKVNPKSFRNAKTAQSGIKSFNFPIHLETYPKSKPFNVSDPPPFLGVFGGRSDGSIFFSILLGLIGFKK